MEAISIVGIIIFTGFVFGEICTRLHLPKVTGYIVAGIMLNPGVTHIIPESFVENTTLVTNISLAFITFSVGGTLFFPTIRNLGKPIIFITLFEAESAFILVAVAFSLIGPSVLSIPVQNPVSFYVPLALIIASLASPTDPSATLAIEHQYHAKGETTSTIMGVAAFDDIMGILNYSLAIAVAGVLIIHRPPGFSSVARPVFSILGAVILGCFSGWILNGLTKIIRRETEGVLITLIISLLALCYGIARIVGADELLSTMIMGVFVTNYNVLREKLFKMLERYTEELIFVLFFTVSAMHLDFSVLISNYLAILMFVLFRSAGKFFGTIAGGKLSHSSAVVQKYAAGGLIPQGGIVIGLALVVKQNPVFHAVSDIVINIIIGATIIHEMIGPLVSKYALLKAGEIQGRQ